VFSQWFVIMVNASPNGSVQRSQILVHRNNVDATSVTCHVVYATPIVIILMEWIATECALRQDVSVTAALFATMENVLPPILAPSQLVSKMNVILNSTRRIVKLTAKLLKCLYALVNSSQKVVTVLNRSFVIMDNAFPRPAVQSKQKLILLYSKNVGATSFIRHVVDATQLVKNLKA